MRYGKWRWTGVAALSFWLIVSLGWADPLDEYSFLTEHYPPLNYEENGEIKGISVDILVRIADELGGLLKRSDILLLPWARAYRTALYKKKTCLFATTRTQKREKIFKWVGPIIASKMVLIGKKDRDIALDSLEELSQYKVSAVIDDVALQLLTQAGVPERLLDKNGGVDAAEKIIRKLEMGRIDLWAYEETVARWLIKNQGYDPDTYKVFWVLKQSQEYYAFHRKTPDSLIRRVQAALDEIKNSALYQEILERY